MIEILTNEKIEEIRARADRATPEPWFLADKDSDNSIEVLSADVDGETVPVLEIFGALGSEEVNANWGLCASSRTDIPALCDSHDAQAQQIAELEGANLPLYSDRIRNMETEIATLKANLAEAEKDTAHVADAVVLAVSEIPDRFSPEDDPDMMLVRPAELRNIVIAAIGAASETVKGI